MIELLITLVIVAVGVWLLQYILSRTTISEPIRTVIYIVLGIIVFLWFVRVLTGLSATGYGL